MIDIALAFCMACFTLALLFNFIRIARSQRAADRILALDTMVTNSIALLILYGIFQDTPIYFEASMLIAMVGFVSTVAYSRFVLRGDLIE
jgi:multicomponent K+:H+ antiporter subunit F